MKNIIKKFEQFNLLDPYGEDDWNFFQYNENLSRDEKIKDIKELVNKYRNKSILIDELLVYQEDGRNVYIIDELQERQVVIGKYNIENDDDEMHFIDFRKLRYEKLRDDIINKICSYLSSLYE